MCGIVGYTGAQAALPALLQGLATLEYRGYDSAGVALVDESERLEVIRRAGKLARLRATFNGDAPTSTTGVGHTRWATHGAPTDVNAHPHVDSANRVAIVHNGIIENHEELRSALRADGVEFSSDTDTEVIAQLVGRELASTDGEPAVAALAQAVRAAVRRLVGTFALGVVDRQLPGVIVAARRGAPLLVGRSQDATFLASDAAALVAHTRELEALDDDQIAVLTPSGVLVTDLEGGPANGRRLSIDWDVDATERGDWPHYMLKEIHEQPQAIRATLADRLGAGGAIRLDVEPDGLQRIDRVVFVACGTSAYASMAGRLAVEQVAGIPADVELGSEFRTRRPKLGPTTLVVAVSQSGETADTLAAVEYARSENAPVMVVTNVVASSLARAADGVLYTRAGPEIGVAATKTFTTQVVAMNILALWLAQRLCTLEATWCTEQVEAMAVLGDMVEQALQLEPAIAAEAGALSEASYVMFMGRGAGVPIALEGALKLKEVSYLHAEGYAAGEMKHGPIALIEPGGPVLAVCSTPSVRDKVVSNVAEVKARGAVVYALGTDGDVDLKEHADQVWFLPEVPELWAPVVSVVPLQLLGYHIAVSLGRDVDQPRNLAKTVTVE